MHMRYLQDIIKLIEQGGDEYKDLYVKYIEDFGRNYQEISDKL